MPVIPTQGVLNHLLRRVKRRQFRQWRQRDAPSTETCLRPKELKRTPNQRLPRWKGDTP